MDYLENRVYIVLCPFMYEKRRKLLRLESFTSERLELLRLELF